MINPAFKSYSEFNWETPGGDIVKEVGLGGIQSQFNRAIDYVSSGRILISNLRFNGCRDMPDGCCTVKMQNIGYGLVETKRCKTVGNKAFTMAICQVAGYHHSLMKYGEKGVTKQKDISFILLNSEEYFFWFYLDECKEGWQKLIQVIDEERSKRHITACKLYYNERIKAAAQELQAMYPYYGTLIDEKFDIGKVLTELAEHYNTIN